jgi:hypothetical protein
MRGRVISVRLLAGLLVLTEAFALRPATTASAIVVTPNCPWQTKLDPNTTNVLFSRPERQLLYPALSHCRHHRADDRRPPPSRPLHVLHHLQQPDPGIDGVNDLHVDPSDGNPAHNPFVAGNARNSDGSARDYRVQIINGTRPAGEIHNKVYTTSNDYNPTKNSGHSNAALYIVIDRTYRPDKGFDPGGGEPLPTVTVNLVGGASRALDSSGCARSPGPGSRRGLPPDQHQPAFGGARRFLLPGPEPAPVAQVHQPRHGRGLRDRQLPHRLIAVRSADQDHRHDSRRWLPGDPLENKYVSALLNADAYGRVVVIKSRVPATPDTFNNAPAMGSGQLRYWSVCSNDPITTRFYACVMDDGLTRLDAQGDYCLVVSTPAHRPRNADTDHGVNWLPYGPLHANVVIERNMLPDPGFTNSIQNATPGSEVHYLGAYYPAATYMSVTDFEKGGCSATILQRCTGRPSPVAGPVGPGFGAAPGPALYFRHTWGAALGSIFIRGSNCQLRSLRCSAPSARNATTPPPRTRRTTPIGWS